MVSDETIVAIIFTGHTICVANTCNELHSVTFRNNWSSEHELSVYYLKGANKFNECCLCVCMTGCLYRPTACIVICR